MQLGVRVGVGNRPKTSLYPDPNFPLAPTHTSNQNTSFQVFLPGQASTYSSTVDNGVWALSGSKAANGGIRPRTPQISIDKTKAYLLRYKIKRIQNAPNVTYAQGGVASEFSNTERNIDALKTEVVMPDGFIFREFRIPANFFTGTGSDVKFVVFETSWQDSQSISMELKDFEFFKL